MSRKVVGLILGLCFVFVSCFAGMAADDDYVVKVGSSPVTSSAGVFLAIEQGYFAEYGVKVDISYFKSSAAQMPALLSSGSLDVGCGNSGAGIWNAIAEGAKIRVVADKGSPQVPHNYMALLVRSDHIKSGRYKSPADLKGMKMGITNFGTTLQIITVDALEAAGLTSNDVQFEKMGYSQIDAALYSGALDASMQLEPYITKAQLGGYAEIVAESYDYRKVQQSAAIYFSEDFATKHEDLAVGFMCAYLKGVRDYRNAMLKGVNKDKIVAMLKKHVQIEDDRVWQNMRPVCLNPNGYVRRDMIISDLLWHIKNGYVDSMPNVDKAIDHSFVDRALEKIGVEQD